MPLYCPKPRDYRAAIAYGRFTRHRSAPVIQ